MRGFPFPDRRQVARFTGFLAVFSVGRPFYRVSGLPISSAGFPFWGISVFFACYGWSPFLGGFRLNLGNYRQVQIGNHYWFVLRVFTRFLG
jgi:hypothetical protein